MSQVIDKTSGIPVYLQLKEYLEKAIASGELCPGKRIPSENALSRKCGIHRHTVRNSLRQLAEEGLLQSVPGSGWFVKPPDLKTLQVGVVNFHARQLTSGFFSSMEKGLREGAAHSGCELSFLTTADLEQLPERNGPYNALIFAENQPDINIYRETFKKLDIPVVVCNRQIFGSDLPFVAIDQYYGTRDLVARLTDAGHRKIGCIASDLPLRYVSQRFRGYCDALTEAGIECDRNLCCLIEDSVDFRNRVRELFDRNPDMTALFIGGEVFHRQTFEVIEERGLRVPEDISLVVYDRPEAKYGSLTYLEQPCDKLGVRLFRMVRRICSGEAAGEEIIKPKIVKGDSIKNLKENNK